MKGFRWHGMFALAVVLSALLLACCGASAEGSNGVAYAVTGGNIYFDPNTGTVTGCDATVTTAVIPPTIQGVSVTAIGGEAFDSRENLTKVVLPEGITTIGFRAFGYNSRLTSVNLPGSITSISGGAFNGTTSLHSVGPYGGGYDIEYGWDKEIPEEAFDMAWINSVVIPNGITTIGKRCFIGTGISELSIPDSVTYIGDYAFEDCQNLRTMKLSKNLTSIGERVFEGCANLEALYLPNGLKTIGERAFAKCRNLTSITIPASVNTIDPMAFWRCENLARFAVDSQNRYFKAIDGVLFSEYGQYLHSYPTARKGAYTVPSGVTRIRESAFHDCGNLTEITIPYGVEGIYSWAFHGCEALRTVTLPGSVTTIESNAFRKCTALKTVYYNGAPAQWQNTNFGSYNEPIREADIYYNYHHISLSADENGSASISDVLAAPGQYVYLTALPNYAYRLKRWNVLSGDVTITGNTFIMGNSDVEIRAEYELDERQVFFDPNGGTVDQGSKTVINGEAYGALPIPYYEGNTFDGWYTSADGGTQITYGTTVKLGADQTLYAHWTRVTRSYTVTFNANGGTVDTSKKTVVSGSTYGILPTATRSNYSFNGWYTSASGGTQVMDSTVVNLTADQTLYAHWTSSPASYTVTFNANGGSVSPSSKSVTNGSAYGDLPTPTRSNYTFNGWYTSASGGTQVTARTIVNLTANQTLYAHWMPVYTVTYNANGGTGTPSTQTKASGASLKLSSITPTKTYVIQYNANGGSVSPASKSISCTFKNWNTATNGSGTAYAPGGTYSANANVTLYAQWSSPAAGTLAIPSRSGYAFAGWFTSAQGGTQIKAESAITGNMTIYAHWTKGVNGYTMGVHTYSFPNYSDSDSMGGHCFGMSITSAGYYLNALNISRIGGNANTPLYSFKDTATVRAPICYYQSIQGTYSSRSTVAGGSYYLYGYYSIDHDWQEVVSYVRNHAYDRSGLLQIGFRKRDEGGHAINFLRYENVNGQDRLYAYDNNYPNQEIYFYRDSSGHVRQSPVQTFSGPIDCIALRNCRTYFDIVGGYDRSHALYMARDAATVRGYTYSYMETDLPGEDYVMYEIPADQDRVIIIPNRDYADFVYMDTEYSFGEITDDTYGELTFASLDEGAVVSKAVFSIHQGTEEFGRADFTLPKQVTTISASAFEGIAAQAVYIPDTCVSIGAYAFRNAAVKKIRIPAGCEIASTAFDGCWDVRIFGKVGSQAEAFCKVHDNCTFIEE